MPKGEKFSFVLYIMYIYIKGDPWILSNPSLFQVLKTKSQTSLHILTEISNLRKKTNKQTKQKKKNLGGKLSANSRKPQSFP